jgi:hypothetical protein
MKMQTIQLQVKDDYVQNVVNLLSSLKEVMIESVEVKKDKNLEMDSYFYERRESLHQLREDVRSGKMEMLSEEEAEADMDSFEEELIFKYAN